MKRLVTALAIVATTLVATSAAATAETITADELSPKQKVTLQVVSQYFADDPVMIKVAYCESSLEHTEDDGTVKKGDVDPRDTGLMQINLGYHKRDAARLGLDLNNLQDNMAYAKFLKKHQGLSPWKASAGCWNNLTLPKPRSLTS